MLFDHFMQNIDYSSKISVRLLYMHIYTHYLLIGLLEVIITENTFVALNWFTMTNNEAIIQSFLWRGFREYLTYYNNWKSVLL